ncbi:MAG: DUF3126 family protein [Hyphomicrobiaceae bacterium]|nr:DUF3126 family protein [Hyphomicrobiaceae bacterium]
MSAAITPAILIKLQTYLRKAFVSQALSVRARPKKSDVAEVFVNDEPLGLITIDDEDGDVTYQFAWTIKEKPQPISLQELLRIQTYLRERLVSKTLAVRGRGKLKDSAEVFVGDDSLALISFSKDSYDFNMAILDIDLDDIV